MSQHLAAQYHTFRDFNIEQGLPQSEVNAITDDHLGYLWVGTNGGGLCRFDGRSFDVFDKKAGLPDNVILSLFQDSQTLLWIATPKGIVRYDGLAMHPIFKEDTTIIADGFRFLETSDGNIWFIARLYDRPLSLYTIEGDSIISGSDLFKEVLSDNDLYYAGSWGRKKIILSTAKGIYTIDNRDIQFDALNKRITTEKQVVIPLLEDRMKRIWLYVMDQHRNATVLTLNTRGELSTVLLPKGILANQLINLFEDRDGGLWTSLLMDGLMYTKGNTTTFFNQSNGLSSSVVRHIFQDREGNFWFGTLGEGLIRYSSNFFTSFNETNGLTDNLIMRIFEDSKGVKYFCDGRGGLNIFDGYNLRSFTFKDMPNVGVLHAFCETAAGRKLFGSNTGLWSFDGEHFAEVTASYGLVKGTPVHDLIQDGDTLIVGTGRIGVLKVAKGKIVKQYQTTNSNLISNRINSLYLDKQRRLWICTGKGVSVLNNEKIVSYGEKNGLQASDVFQVTQDKAGNIWMANFTGGLICFDGQQFTAYNGDNGLKTDVVYSVLTDQDGNIWAGSQLGVDHLSVNSEGKVTGIENFGRYDGFIGIENNASAALCDQYGVLWFGTIKGVMRCIPGERIVNQLAPAVYVAGVSLNSSKTDWTTSPFINLYDSLKPWQKIPMGLSLNSEINHVSFTFDALCYSQPEKVLYRWKLEPIDEDFCPPTSQNSATYTMLPPGKYTLNVVACNNDGVWNEDGDTFRFEVTAFWWKRPFVLFFIFFFLVSLAVLSYLAHRRQLVKYRQELDVLALSKQQEMGKLRGLLTSKDEEIDRQMRVVNQLSHKVELSTRHFSMVSDLYQMVCDNLAEARVVSAIQQLMESAANPGFFAFGCFNPDRDSLVFSYAVQKGSRLPVFSFPADDVALLPVHCIRNRHEVFVSNWEEQKQRYISVKRLLVNDFNASSIVIVPFTLADETPGVLVIQSENKDAFTDYHFQLLRLVASMLGRYRH